MDVMLTEEGVAYVQSVLGADNVFPEDRVISVWSGVTYLYDKQIPIADEMILRIINGSK